MEQTNKYEEWYFQSDYDLETAEYMLQSERNIYCIFMCHLSLEKALKGLYRKHTNEIPPKLHNLLYFVNRLNLVPTENDLQFIGMINSLSITTRYPEDLRKMITTFSTIQVSEILQQTKSVQQWIKQQ
ncbi:MAG: HEPN domain-containing protein [Prevotellaceae bacterium]|jgi:HEPN domain-containing protein|nr:HEPN domain-containing protein [Prevotellaceae bacterium]